MSKQKRKYPPKATRTPEEALGEARRNTRVQEWLKRKRLQILRQLRGED